MTVAPSPTQKHPTARPRARKPRPPQRTTPALCAAACLLALAYSLVADPLLARWRAASDAKFAPPPPDPADDAGDGSVRDDWRRVVGAFLSTVGPSDIRTRALRAAHASGHVARTCALVEVRGAHVFVNATGLLRKYREHGRFVSLQAVLSAAVDGLGATERHALTRVTALVDVSDGSMPHVATLGVARHWRSWLRALPVPLGNPRGGDDGSATPVLGWDAYVGRHVLARWGEYPWRAKTGRAVFRGALRMQHAVLGSCNGGRLNHCKNASNWAQVNRGVMYNIARAAPRHLDVGFTELLRHHNRGDEQFENAPPVVPGLPFADFQRYKLIINVGSNHDWAERLRGLMFMNSAVMHHQAESQEFFTPLLRPWYNMIPFKVDMSDLVSNARYALSHEAETRAIRDRQNAFAQRYLSEAAMLEYWREMLREYAKRQYAADHPRAR